VGTAPEHTTGRRVTPSTHCVQAPAKPSQPSTLPIFVIPIPVHTSVHTRAYSPAYHAPLIGLRATSAILCSLPCLLEHAKSFLVSVPRRGSLLSACILFSSESETLLLLPCAQFVGVKPLTGPLAACQRAYPYLTCTQDCRAALACASLPRRAVGCIRGEVVCCQNVIAAAAAAISGSSYSSALSCGKSAVAVS
jgi:hypothetical protein